MLFVAMPDAFDLSFAQFWALYPRRVAKKEARKAWQQLHPSEALVTEILAALAWQVRQPCWLEKDGIYVPHASTYIHQERWTDEPPASLRVRPTDDPCAVCGYPEPRWHSKVECNRMYLEQQKAAKVSA